MDALRTHPMVVAGVLRQNPFYQEPDAFVEEMRTRRREPRVAAASRA
jgi:hypothetical protein